MIHLLVVALAVITLLMMIAVGAPPILAMTIIAALGLMYVAGYVIGTENG